MVALPALIPVTLPVEIADAATAELLLLHTPPDTVLPKADTIPTHISVGPVIGAKGCTVTTFVATQPVAN